MRKLKIVAGGCEIAYNKWYHQQQPADSKSANGGSDTNDFTARSSGRKEKLKRICPGRTDLAYLGILQIPYAVSIHCYGNPLIGTSLYRQSFTTRLSMAVINDRRKFSTEPLIETEGSPGCGKDIIEINDLFWIQMGNHVPVFAM
ncbi:MAG: hypothetical protein ACLVG5_11500 [Clostridium sp.]